MTAADEERALIAIHEAGHWWQSARCRRTDPEVFFPEKGKPTRPAKSICARCPVRAECLEEALAAGYVAGVWGGLSAQERRPMLVARRRAAAAA